MRVKTFVKLRELFELHVNVVCPERSLQITVSTFVSVKNRDVSGIIIIHYGLARITSDQFDERAFRVSHISRVFGQ